MRLVPPRGLDWEVSTLKRNGSFYFKIPKSADKPNIPNSDSTNEQTWNDCSHLGDFLVSKEFQAEDIPGPLY